PAVPGARAKPLAPPRARLEAALSRITEIEYHEDSSRRFAALHGSPWHVFLDSGFPGSDAGRFGILAAEPYATLTTHGAESEIRTRGGVERSSEDPLALLKRLLGEPSPRAAALPRHLPFAGGAIGYLAYDLGRRFERLPSIAIDDVGTPDAAFGLYDWAVIVDHAERRAWLRSAEHTSDLQSRENLG